jgi:Cu/Ag efflux protein CusF
VIRGGCLRFIQCAVMMAAVLGVGVPGTLAGQKAVAAGDAVTATATIQAIDSAKRRVTLKYADGSTDTISAGPEVQRFNELKVGDVVSFSYVESVVVAVTKPGSASAATVSDPTLTRSKGARPGGMVSQQSKASVVVAAIDPKVPSISVRTASGHKRSYKVEDKTTLEGIKVGDTIEITYTEALMVSVQSAKE